MPRLLDALPDASVAGSILVGYLLDTIAPVAVIVPAPYNLAGWLPVAAGIWLAIRLVVGLTTKRTSTDPTGSPTRLVTTGAFAISRNPLYLAYLVTVFGAAVVMGSLTAFVAPLLCYLLIRIVIIPIEERIMQERFGSEYQAYKRAVCRWI